MAVSVGRGVSVAKGVFVSVAVDRRVWVAVGGAGGKCVSVAVGEMGISVGVRLVEGMCASVETSIEGLDWVSVQPVTSPRKTIIEMIKITRLNIIHA